MGLGAQAGAAAGSSNRTEAGRHSYGFVRKHTHTHEFVQQYNNYTLSIGSILSNHSVANADFPLPISA